MYRGLTLTAADALQHGLVDAVAEPDRVLDEALAVAEGLAAVPFDAFHLTKQQLRGPALQRMREGGQIDAIVLEAWASEPILTAIRDYVARTLKR
jgi:enoyl-CoA hydratase/carnithine racemase